VTQPMTQMILIPTTPMILIPTTPMKLILTTQNQRLMKSVVSEPTKTKCSIEVCPIKLSQPHQIYPSKIAKIIAPTTLILLCKIMEVSAGVKTTFKESPCMEKLIVMPMVVAYVTMFMITYALEAYMLLDKSSMSMLTLHCNSLKIQTDGSQL